MRERTTLYDGPGPTAEAPFGCLEDGMAIERIEAGSRMSQGAVHGNTVYLAGQVASDPMGTGVTAQTQNILEQIDRLLATAGSDKNHILSATVYLADIAHFAEMNAAWDAWVSRESPPTRATVEARLCDPQYLVEIVVVAAKSA
jgi:enamine deaminase RidA (YjgF/YER057c/UK114 family)